MKTSSLGEIVAQAEKRAIISALRRHTRNGSAPDMGSLCKELKVTRTTVWRKLKQHGLRKRIVVDAKDYTGRV